MKSRAITDDIVYFPDNGCVVRQTKNEKGKVIQGEILVRLVYADDELTKVLLDALTRHEAGG